MMLGLGLGLCNPQSGPRWSPLDAYPDARYFRADTGVTSAGSVIRARAGVVAEGTGVLEPDLSLTLAPLDGQGFFRLTSGRLLLVGGAPSGNAGARVNTVWSSDDDGATWAELLANEGQGTETRFACGHSQGYVTHNGYAYVIGGDPFDPNGEVWRTALAGDGTTWTLVGSSAPTSTLRIFLYWSQGGNLYVAGGQTDMSEPSSAVSTVWRSTDDGANWTSLGDAPWDARGIISGPLPVLDGVAYLIGGGAYDLEGTSDIFFDDVWSFDGSTWTEVLATGHGQFNGVRYHTPIAHDGMLAFFNGSPSVGTEHARGYASNDGGVTWHYLGDQNEYAPWGNTHAAAAVELPDRILITHGFQSDNIYAITLHSGALASSWVDQGSDGLTATQGTDANKPVVDTSGASALIFTREQWMTFAAIDSNAVDTWSFYFVASTLNTDSSADSPTAPPCCVIGNNDAGGSVVNGFGFSGGSLRYVQYSGGYQTSDEGSTYNDDTPHVFGVVHTSGSVKLYVDGVQVLDDTTGVGFFPGTGWKSIGASYGNSGKGALRLFAIVAVKEATDDAFRSGLQSLAEQEWL